MKKNLEIKISIIIPIYNCEKYITECLDSILNQSLKEIEVICIDDLSVDNSAYIIKKYKDKRLKYIQLDKNYGPAEARNKGIHTAKGEFISFIDSDDILASSDALETLYTNAIKNNIYISGGNFMAFDSSSKQNIPDYWNEIFFKSSGIKKYDDYLFPAGFWRFIYNRVFLLENEITFPEYRLREDPVFLMKAMSKCNEFYITNEITYLYRINQKEINWSKNDIKEALKSFKDCLEDHTKKKRYKHYLRELDDFVLYLEKIRKCGLIEFSKDVNQIYKSIPFDKIQNEENKEKLKYIKTLVQKISRPRKQIEREIVHIMKTDKITKTFVDFLNDNFDSSKHLILCQTRTDNFDYKNPEGENVILFDDIYDFDFSSEKIKKIIVHGLFIKDIVGYLFNNNEVLKKAYWSMWGNDLYNAPRGLANDFVRTNFKGYIHKLDQEYAEKKYGITQKFFDAFYKFAIKKETLDKIEVNNKDYYQIQINNSCCHSTIEMLEKLSRYKDENIKITTVLSYGNLEYKNEIVKKGRELFAEKFEYLDKIISPEEYAKHLAGNDILILNQDRQQGVGNILASIYLGKKVYIKKDISVNKYLKDMDIQIEDSEKIEEQTFTELIENSTSQQNKKYVSKLFDDKYLAECWKKVFND